jgi:hypothetical protein
MSLSCSGFSSGLVSPPVRKAKVSNRRVARKTIVKATAGVAILEGLNLWVCNVLTAVEVRCRANGDGWILIHPHMAHFTLFLGLQTLG